MHIHEIRKGHYEAKINWSRELTFANRQINYINDNVPDERGVYCVYAKKDRFPYTPKGYARKKFSSLVYIGSGYLMTRLTSHITTPQNDVLSKFMEKYNLAYRYEVIANYDDEVDWPRQVEAALLHLFEKDYGELPPANRRREGFQDIADMKKMIINETGEYSILNQ